MTPMDLGYSIHEGVFRRAEMTRILEAVNRADVARTKAGARNLLAASEVRALASDTRLLRLASQHVGIAAFPFRATLFDKSARSNWLVTWHQDIALPVKNRVDDPEWGPWSVKGGVLHAIAPAAALRQVIALRVHLDDSTARNGPLRVLPGTHIHGVLVHARIQALAGATPGVECLCDTGGVVALRPLTVHGSSKAHSDSPRRVLHIEYAAAANLGRGVEVAVG
jgi:ectoine hydroxylase-related dioxygenase (phytanoyl-CoA dioxygenase family)